MTDETESVMEETVREMSYLGIVPTEVEASLRKEFEKRNVSSIKSRKRNQKVSLL